MLPLLPPQWLTPTPVHSRIPNGSRSSRWCAVAENVGVGGSQTIVHNAFLGSGPHKANMIGNYDRVGTGVAYGRGQVWVVQIYLRGTC